MATPKEDCESLLGFVLPFAEQMLARFGEFYPYGGAMLPNGEIVSVAGYDGHEHPPSNDVISLLKERFVHAAKAGQYKAAALVYDIRYRTSQNDEQSDAIAVSLNHRDGYSVIVIFPYRLDSGKPVLHAPVAQKGEGDIFPPI